MLLRALAYREHPYRWATIGLAPEHIEEATLDDVRAFYRRWYRPSNAILSLSGDLPEERMFALAEKWFGGIENPADTPSAAPLPAEPEQREPRRMEVVRDVPATAISIAFHIGGRTSRSFFAGDLTSDLLAGGDSGRLYQTLVKERRLFASANAYVSGDVDPGLFVFTGHLLPTTAPEQAEAAIWDEIDRLKNDPVPARETEKVKNKFEANTLFGELNVMNKALNLGFYEMLGDLSLVDREVELYRSIGAEEIMEFGRRVFRPENSSTLLYTAKR